MMVGEPVPMAASLGELKAHLRLEDEREDALLAGWLRTASEMVETELGWLLLQRDVTETLQAATGKLRLTRGPVQNIVSVEVAEGEDWRTIDPSLYELARDKDSFVLLLQAGAAEIPGCFRVSYVAGAADTPNAVPGVAREAVIRLAAYWYANRDDGEVPGMPTGVSRMLNPLRTRRLLRGGS